MKAHTKLESLRNLAERCDGYGNSIRRVMEVQWDRIHGIRGVVADIITTEKKYETAIETALGGKYPEHCYGFRRNSKAADRIPKRGINTAVPPSCLLPVRERPVTISKTGGFKRAGV